MTHQQHEYERITSERLRATQALIRRNSVHVAHHDTFTGLTATDYSERRAVFVALNRAETLALTDSLLNCLDLSDLQHIAERVVEIQTQIADEIARKHGL